MTVQDCPNPQLLRSHLLGHVLGRQAVWLDGHLASCHACLQIARQLDAQGELAAARGGGNLKLPVSEESVAEIIDRGKRLAQVVNAISVGEVILAQERGKAPSTSVDLLQLNSDMARDALEELGLGQLPSRVPEGDDNPPHLPRFRIERMLGQGGFGKVYLAYDEQLQRSVAVKVLHCRVISRLDDAEAYLNEARTVAKLNHAHIVPVFDVGSNGHCPFYVVSRYIEGTDLAARLQQGRLTYVESAELLATVAEALHYSHGQGLVHRDVKPGNILLGSDGQAYVVDFGLALREEHFGKGPRFLGTPPYISPEQARGEGHRVDARADIYGLGAVMYELLTGQPIFEGRTRKELLERIATAEAVPPRQLDDTVPPELERICCKATAKLIGERYLSADHMAKDLRMFLAEQASSWGSAPLGNVVPQASEMLVAMGGSTQREADGHSSSASSDGRSYDARSVRVVPKGLRAFDAHDADFFLELLPGPRDREGLPESVRFWKTRIEGSDSQIPFQMGLIYGPSGCGKSSLVRAGLLPRLSPHLIPVYIEATPEHTEQSLLHRLRKRCPALAADGSLIEALSDLRRGIGIPPGTKVLIVIDQFEQWLHARNGEECAELVQALRQCDGARLQCIVMVRDDFWMAVTRFFRQLEVRLQEGHNLAAVDLFSARHARQVLAEFGRAYRRLPNERTGLSRDQVVFLDQAISGLADEGKVICVRLSLFAEMMKDRSWTPASLKQAGGASGVGVSFLESSLAASTAPPQHRWHQEATQLVLKALLPDAGTNIKGHMRSAGELLEASGYGSRPEQFEELIRLLDHDLRLVTPADPRGKRQLDANDASGVAPEERYYQLTHDYLVPSVRDWLTRKQKETRRGRAELRLEERSAIWTAKPENRHLPSWPEYAAITCLTVHRHWTPQQVQMMSRARRVHGFRLIMAVLILGTLAGLGVATRRKVVADRALLAAESELKQKRTRAESLVEALLTADVAEVPDLLSKLYDYRQWADPELRQRHAQAGLFSREKLRTALALLPRDEAFLPYLIEHLLQAEAADAHLVVSQLERFAVPPSPGESGESASAFINAARRQQARRTMLDQLWSVATQPKEDTDPRVLRAASGLAQLDPADPRWPEIRQRVVGQLVRARPTSVAYWQSVLRPVGRLLAEPLVDASHDERLGPSERNVATDLLLDYGADLPATVAKAIQFADERQFLPFLTSLESNKQSAVAELSRLSGEIEQQLAGENSESVPSIPEEVKESLAKRRVNIAVALMKFGVLDAAWRCLEHRPDPRTRSYLIHRLAALDAEPEVLITQALDEQTEVSVRRAILLALGEFDGRQLGEEPRQTLTAPLLSLFRSHPDAGLHAAAEWLLLRWGHGESVKPICQTLRESESKRQTRQAKEPRDWYVTSQGQTMVIVQGGELPAPAPAKTPDAPPREITSHIDHQFAICATPITLQEYDAFRQATQNPVDGITHDPLLLERVTTADSPIVFVNWYDAAAYCNWLSATEGIAQDQWCYEKNDAGKYDHGMRAKSNYGSLSGYRLPTEAEWEFACRAGSATLHFWGHSEELLGEYAWFENNSELRTWPVRGKKPNDLGLFDMHHINNWCHDLYNPGKNGGESPHDSEVVLDKILRSLRGGTYWDLGFAHQSASRNCGTPEHAYISTGFRLARTYIVAP